MNSLTTTQHDSTDLVQVKSDQALTDSLKVSEIFSKQHKDVLRAIDRLDCSEGFGRATLRRPLTPTSRTKSSPCTS